MKTSQTCHISDSIIKLLFRYKQRVFFVFSFHFSVSLLFLVLLSIPFSCFCLFLYRQSVVGVVLSIQRKQIRKISRERNYFICWGTKIKFPAPWNWDDFSAETEEKFYVSFYANISFLRRLDFLQLPSQRESSR